MTYKRHIPILAAAVGLGVTASITLAHGQGWHSGHGHPYPFHEPHHKVCVPELVKKKRVVYDYICIPFCIRRCASCSHKLKLLGGGHGHGCSCGLCGHGHECPDCIIRYKKILVKRVIEDGCEWKCKLKDGCHHFSVPPSEEAIPIPPPTSPFMPPAKNGNKKLSVPAPDGLPAVTAPAEQYIPAGVPTTGDWGVPQGNFSNESGVPPAQTVPDN